MEILYGIGIFAVFVLCLALLSTARRILRSSSLSNVQFGTTRIYGAESEQNELASETDSTRGLAIAAKDIDFESTRMFDEPAMPESVMAEAAPADVVEQKMFEEHTVPAELFPAVSEPVEELVEGSRTWADKWTRFPKPSRQTCNYALECVLLGISAYALFKAQRDTLRYKAAPLPAAHDRVA